jgi:hypothetical protein
MKKQNEIAQYYSDYKSQGWCVEDYHDYQSSCCPATKGKKVLVKNLDGQANRTNPSVTLLSNRTLYRSDER